MAPSTSTSLGNGLQVARGLSAYTKNPRELDVPIGEGILISLSILYQSFYQLLIAKDWTEPAWASRTYTLGRRNNWILRRDMVRMSTYRVPITDLGSKLLSLTCMNHSIKHSSQARAPQWQVWHHHHPSRYRLSQSYRHIPLGRNVRMIS